jgi:hypothetical protein
MFAFRKLCMTCPNIFQSIAYVYQLQSRTTSLPRLVRAAALAVAALAVAALAVAALAVAALAVAALAVAALAVAARTTPSQELLR